MARTSIEKLKLMGNQSNLNRALKREEKESIPLAPSDQALITKIDSLIDATLKAAAKGATRNRKTNPASKILLQLLQAKRMILKDRGAPEEKPSRKILAELDQMLAGVEKAN